MAKRGTGISKEPVPFPNHPAKRSLDGAPKRVQVRLACERLLRRYFSKCPGCG